MKYNKYTAWIETYTKKGKGRIIMLGSYYAFILKEAKIHAMSDAIKRGLDYELVKVVEEKEK